MDEITRLKFDQDGLMTAREAAAYLRVSQETLRKYEELEDNPLPVIRLGDGPKAPRRYDRAKFAAWLDARSRWSRPDPDERAS